MTQDKAQELVERLKPNAVVDHVPGLAASELRASGFGDLAERLNAWIVRNNALKSEASLALSQAYERGQESMRERAASAADEWEPVERLLPMADDAANEAAHTGQYEAGERIADAIRSLPIEQDGEVKNGR